jgi:hypothetical protein
MDTLCIPVGQQDLACRLLQIAIMASIYQGATKVLAIDRELLGLIVGTGGRFASRCDLMARIACSVWMSRSWTMHEGALARSVKVQCQNTAIRIQCGRVFVDATREDYAETELTESRKVGHPLYECATTTIALRAFLSSALASDNDFTTTWNELAGRSTSRPEDTPVILGNLLGLKTSLLSNCDEQWEMTRLILLSLRRIPLSLFFMLCPRHVEHDLGIDAISDWLPSISSGERLLPSPMLRVLPTFFNYHYISDSSFGITVYRLNELNLLTEKSDIYLRVASSSRTIFTVARVYVNARPPGPGFLGWIYIVSAATALSDSGGLLPGACFGIVEESENNSGPEFVLRFIHAIRLRRLTPDEVKSLRLEEAQVMTELARNCHLRIEYREYYQEAMLFYGLTTSRDTLWV